VVSVPSALYKTAVIASRLVPRRIARKVNARIGGARGRT
jgi:hypothetical protein